MRSTLEKFWELRDYHGAGSVWSSSPLSTQGVSGGLVAWGIQHPKLEPTRLVVYQGDRARAVELAAEFNLELDFRA